jgi:effector-binding domain-containing protein
MSNPNVVIKRANTLRIAEATGFAAAFTPDAIGPVFMKTIPTVEQHLTASGARPGMMVAYYERPDAHGKIIVHAGFDIGDQPVPDVAGIHVTELPAVDVASFVFRGAMTDIASAYDAIARAVEEQRYTMAGYGRELYVEARGPTSPDNVVEVQVPIRR